MKPAKVIYVAMGFEDDLLLAMTNKKEAISRWTWKDRLPSHYCKYDRTPPPLCKYVLSEIVREHK